MRGLPRLKPSSYDSVNCNPTLPIPFLSIQPEGGFLDCSSGWSCALQCNLSLKKNLFENFSNIVEQNIKKMYFCKIININLKTKKAQNLNWSRKQTIIKIFAQLTVRKIFPPEPVIRLLMNSRCALPPRRGSSFAGGALFIYIYLTGNAKVSIFPSKRKVRKEQQRGAKKKTLQTITHRFARLCVGGVCVGERLFIDTSTTKNERNFHDAGKTIDFAWYVR